MTETAKVGINDDNKPAGSLVAGLAALTAVLGAAGVVGGVVGRMVGEHPLDFALALGLVLIAGLLGVIAGLFAGNKTLERVLLIASNLLLLAGLLFGMIGAIRVWSDTRVPSVTATPVRTADGTFLNVTVKDSGLNSTEHVKLLVEPLHYVTDNDRSDGERRILAPRRAIYSASLGSNEDGKVDHTAKVRLPPNITGYVGARAYLGGLPTGCYASPARADGCISVAILQDPERPQLSAAWSKGKTLKVRLKARDIYLRTVRLRVVGKTSRAKSGWREVAYWELAPDANGVFDRSLTIPTVRHFAKVCIVASTVRYERCPPRRGTGDDLTWVRYSVSGK
jgi:hypothetical protein